MNKEDILHEFDLAIKGSEITLSEMDKKSEEYTNLSRFTDRMVYAKVFFIDMWNDAEERKTKCKMASLDHNFTH